MSGSVVAELPSELAKHGSLFCNADSNLIDQASSSLFIHCINIECTGGFGLIPLVGAGFSAPSGIPLVQQLKAYLHRCICVALGAEEKGMRPWNPRVDNWPPFVDRDRPEPIDWQRLVYAEFDRRRLANPADPELQVLQEGFGAMAEWRTSLLFLSRLVRDLPSGSASAGEHHLRLDVPKQELIDACFREVMRGKHPSLTHHMLSALSGLLRIDIVLSTNFDDLLERAFKNTGNDLEAFEVHLGSSLPDWSAVSRVRALVKLHGSQYSMRADYSLDGQPSEIDKKRFLEYLLNARLQDETLDHLSGGWVGPVRQVKTGLRSQRTRSCNGRFGAGAPNLCIY